MKLAKTLGELKLSGYQPRSIKTELRANLIESIKNKQNLFDGIIGYDSTVLPDVQRAILSKHNMLFLGLRGQAKTRIARLMVKLLDEYIPVVEGSDLNDDPIQPISKFAIELIKEKGDDTPITWLHRSERYVEKLATPDVTVADLIGDVDPIKAASLKLHYSNENVIHFGLVPRANRSIFVINELPDLQARIQVALFNALQEGDIQIRGFKLRLPLDIEFVFTANPEDYTNRGSIVTPLKDRIESQIVTHYPTTIEVAKKITQQEAKLSADQISTIYIPEIAKDLIEYIVMEARDSELVDQNSGVSARLSIAAFENLVSTAERRMLINNEKATSIRLSDYVGIIPAIVGKVELVYEGEQEGYDSVAHTLIENAIKKIFDAYFPNPDKVKKGKEKDLYGVLREWFGDGNSIEVQLDSTNEEHRKTLESVVGLRKVAESTNCDAKDLDFMLELVLHGLSEYNIVSKELMESKYSFGDLLSNMLGKDDFEEDDEDIF